jgi:hypothetical protein
MQRYMIATLILLICGVALANDLPSGPLPEVRDSQVGYKTVADALADLSNRKNVEISNVRGWTIIADRANFTLWSFAPASYPAYPAVVKRTVTSRTGGGSMVNTSVLCEASKEACDQLVLEFNALTNRLPH